ncbi:hypothetical protein CLV46_2452 [Diaminobutyricimonas aerilata]|uniref:Uncharacterized protein n=1 Tax=Diaminobutyricimonas aerilata TaxID=1162967 RepID=A0A2M9CLT7_9MICO|nr:DUF6157 family protein [Diaminobutyricimonas aerilata]PJJ72875.1 hypothetical protein CLV46_2452 [Diaminobutyricimonas aerilata]
MGTTNYYDTFIAIAPDCPVASAEAPAARGDKPTVAQLQYELIAAHPYGSTSDDVLFAVHAERQGIPEPERAVERERFFARSQACLRSSPLGKRYGWGLHHDAQGRVALVPVGSEEYRRLETDPALTQTRAMRSKRA